MSDPIPKPMAEAPPRKRASWRRRSDARPAEILDAALDAFTEMGFTSARIEDVAERAGLSKGAIYLYFRSKEDLLRALIEREIGPIVRRATGIAADEVADPVAALTFLLTIVSTVMANPRTIAVPRIIMGLGNRFPDLIAEYRDNVVSKMRSALESLVRRGIELGRFRPVDPVAATRAIVGPVFFEALWTHVLGGETALNDPQAFVQAHLAVLRGGLIPEGGT